MHRYGIPAEQVYLSFSPRLPQELGDDARIASIALSLGASVWTCNVDDFRRVPNLVVYRADTGQRIT